MHRRHLRHVGGCEIAAFFCDKPVLGPIVEIPALPLLHALDDPSLCHTVALQLSVTITRGAKRSPFISLRKKRSAALVFRRFCTKISRTTPRWSTARKIVLDAIDLDEDLV
jgi:hypothetical protein